MIIKFTSPQLVGYGFDVGADRVVRFNKHPDGTYMNTRATYSINTRQFTHFDLREAALKEKKPVVQQHTPAKPTSKLTWIIIGLLIIGVLSMTECSFNVNATIDESSEHE